MVWFYRWQINMVEMIRRIIRYFTEPCNPPYDCPFCMHCYNRPADIEDAASFYFIGEKK